MGTHNALLRLGDRVFLEVHRDRSRRERSLLDHGGSISTTSRFRPSSPSGRGSFTGSREPTDIERAAARCPIPLGTVHSLARGDYRWRITITDDGKPPGKGIVPTLIQWDVAAHPADSLPESGVSIAAFAGAHTRNPRRFAARSRRWASPACCPSPTIRTRVLPRCCERRGGSSRSDRGKPHEKAIRGDVDFGAARSSIVWSPRSFCGWPRTAAPASEPTGERRCDSW